jgi:hypothetical protein
MSDMKKKKCHKSWHEMSPGIKILIIFGGIIVIAGFIVLFGFVFMWLWNWIMPNIFGLPAVSYWEGWGILILAYILFHSKHGSGWVGERHRKHKLRRKMQDIENHEPEDLETGKA